MTEQEMIKAAKTNWLAWQGLKELKPEVAAWMERHKKELLVSYESIWEERATPECVLSGGNTYRLRPDYETDRYWFQPDSSTVFYGAGFGDNNGWLEVTPEYAAYLVNKPEGEWELRIPKAGDDVHGLWNTRQICKDASYGVDIGSHDRGYRWCKPKQPEAGWREYDVIANRGKYYVKDLGSCGGDVYLPNVIGRVGFGGVQFEGCDTWSMLVAAYRRDETLYIYDSGEIPSVTATPIKVRFWEARQ